jgi:TfoX/Sxy family transcriptional regulator of competence genes
MREWSAMLEHEVLTWPRVSVKRMFGMRSLYRDATIFAALPSTRTLISEECIIFKLETPSSSVLAKLQADDLVNAEFGVNTRWYGYRIRSHQDLHGAIEWLSHAYEAATKTKRAKEKKKKRARITRSL